MALQADVAVLASEASNFDRIAVELQGVMARVEQVGADLATHMKTPQAGMAAQAALARFNAAAHQQNQLLIEISQKIHVSGVKYSTTDDDNFQHIQSTMNI
ncbi:WXG100 family type VII secretion target [Mycobacterium sp. MAA66]|jgi:WXG100 family type VII secretion target|uniref:WXG100 family type VII secretion target n=1 Tax=Mycobacterium sp. MAA66 TaxID=3156297 RepID=UPI0035189274